MAEGKEAAYQRLRGLIVADKIHLQVHKRFSVDERNTVYASCGVSLEFFEKAYRSGDVVLKIGGDEPGPTIGTPIAWDKAVIRLFGVADSPQSDDPTDQMIGGLGSGLATIRQGEKELERLDAEIEALEERISELLNLKVDGPSGSPDLSIEEMKELRRLEKRSRNLHAKRRRLEKRFDPGRAEFEERMDAAFEKVGYGKAPRQSGCLLLFVLIPTLLALLIAYPLFWG